jgi:hypothetical protein
MKILGFGKSEPKQTIDAIVTQLDDEIGEKTLAKLIDPEDRKRELWGVVLLGADSLHIIYGEGAGWFGRMIGGNDPDQKLLSIPLGDIERIDLPAERGWLMRLIQGPTVIAGIEIAGGETVRIEVDRREPFLSALDAAVRRTIA